MPPVRYWTGRLAGTLALLVLVVGCGGRTSPEADELPEQTAVSEIEAPAGSPGEEFRQVMAFAIEEELHERPVGEVIVTLAERYLGRPYAAGILDEPLREELVVSFVGFDCVTYVETMLALAQSIAAEDYRYDDFLQRLEALRYRGGEMGGYCSRLHYFSEWIADNERRGHVRNITRELGGIELEKTLDFMSTHREAYPKLIGSEDNYECILAVESRLRDLALFYIPQGRIHAVYVRLQPGDIIATATDIEGLDVTHTGLVYKQPDGGTGLIHASLSGEVKISPDLESYIQGVEQQIGIIVARPLDPGQISS